MVTTQKFHGSGVIKVRDKKCILTPAYIFPYRFRTSLTACLASERVPLKTKMSVKSRKSSRQLRQPLYDHLTTRLYLYLHPPALAVPSVSRCQRGATTLGRLLILNYTALIQLNHHCLSPFRVESVDYCQRNVQTTRKVPYSFYYFISISSNFVSNVPRGRCVGLGISSLQEPYYRVDAWQEASGTKGSFNQAQLSVCLKWCQK